MHPATKVLLGRASAVTAGGITHVGSFAANVTQGVATNITMTLPTVADDDVGVIFFYSDIPADPASLITTPTGWTAVGSPFPVTTVAGRGMYTQAWFRVLSSGDSNPVLAISNGANRYRGAVLSVFRGVDASTPLDVTPTHFADQNDTTPDPPAITPLSGSRAIVTFVAYSHGDTTGFTPPSGMTLGAETIGAYRNVASAYLLDSNGAGTYTPGNWTADDDATGRSESHCATFALRPL